MKDGGSTRVITLRDKANQYLQALENARLSWWSHWIDLANFIQPRLGRFLQTPNEGTRGRPRNQRIIDSTGTTSSQRFAAGLLAGIASPARPWFKLKIPGMELDEGSTAKVWLDESEKRMRDVLSNSNFYRSMAMLLEEIGVFGTGTMMLYEDFEDVLRCFPMAAGEYYLFVDERLDVTGLGRKIVMTVKEMVGNFGIDNVGPSVREMYTMGRFDTEWMIGHLVVPNDPSVWDMQLPAHFKYGEIYFQWGSDVQTETLRVKGFHEKPFAAGRWNVTGNDAYGRSPGMDALGDVKQLQIMQKRSSQLIDKLVNPPMIGDAILQNEPTSTIPGAVTFIARGAQEIGFKPAYQVNHEGVSAIEEKIAQTQSRIKTVFFEDLFLMISQLDTVRTATEVAERKEEKMLMLGPALERLHDELLKIVVERLFGIMYRLGMFPKDVPQEMKGREVSVEFISTLALAQKAVATTAIERLFGFVGNIAAAKPEALDNVDADEAIREYADMVGAPPKVVVDAKAVAKMRAARAQQEQAAQAMQTSLAGAQGAATLSKVDVGGGQNAVQKIIGNQAA